MQFATIIALACLVSMAYSYPHYPAVDALDIPDDAADHEAVFDTAELDRSPRTKRGLLLLKKKLLLGAFGLKAAKVGAAAGAVGAIALKSKPKAAHYGGGAHAVHSYGYSSHGPEWKVEVHSWH